MEPKGPAKLAGNVLTNYHTIFYYRFAIAIIGASGTVSRDSDWRLYRTGALT
jgi:hypothetical protein